MDLIFHFLSVKIFFLNMQLFNSGLLRAGQDYGWFSFFCTAVFWVFQDKCISFIKKKNLKIKKYSFLLYIILFLLKPCLILHRRSFLLYQAEWGLLARKLWQWGVSACPSAEWQEETGHLCHLRGRGDASFTSLPPHSVIYQSHMPAV